jgi:monoamine oxidase
LAAEADPVAAALVDLAALFPAAPELFEGGTFVDWIGERGIGGGFSLLPPGAASLRADLPRRHGRVFFAGEHLATWRGFLEGALESAESAVTAMMTA